MVAAYTFGWLHRDAQPVRLSNTYLDPPNPNPNPSDPRSGPRPVRQAAAAEPPPQPQPQHMLELAEQATGPRP